MARRGIGRTAENPSVGAVLVKDGVVIAQARTADGGRPHAEPQAIDFAGNQARGATLYVTLEPCTHYGQTPPCVEAIIKAKISRVVIGCLDVNPQVQGKSIDLLKAAGIDVDTGICEPECKALIAGFTLRMTQYRPFITIKTACSLDGKVALKNGQSQWITGETARRHVHLERSKHDAIMVGIGTALADDPSLTTRLSGLDHRAVRIVLDSKMQLPLDSELAKSAKDHPVWLFYIEENTNKEELERAGVETIQVKSKALKPILSEIAKRGVNNLFIEGGPTLHSEFLVENLCDKLLIYRAACVLGGEAKDAFHGVALDDLSKRFSYVREQTKQLGSDMVEIYKFQDRN